MILKKWVIALSSAAIISFASPSLFAGEGHHHGSAGHSEMKMEDMHKHMQDFKSLMNKIHDTQDAKSLQTLINANMGTMMKGMDVMDAMMKKMMKH